MNQSNVTHLKSARRRRYLLSAAQVKRWALRASLHGDRVEHIVSRYWTPEHIDVTHTRIHRGSPGKGEFLTQLFEYERNRRHRRVEHTEKLDKLSVTSPAPERITLHDLALAESFVHPDLI